MDCCCGRLYAWRRITLSWVFCSEHRLVRNGDACGCMELNGLELHSLSVELGRGAGGSHSARG